MEEAFFYQTDEQLNNREAWSAEDFPKADFHYFRESGCMMTSLWNMFCYYELPDFKSKFHSPWELNERCKSEGVFYENANIELGLIHKAVPVKYINRLTFDELELKKQLSDGIMCLLRVNGINGPYHYVLPMIDRSGMIRCFDPKNGYRELSSYEMIYQIIRFEKMYEKI